MLRANVWFCRNYVWVVSIVYLTFLKKYHIHIFFCALQFYLFIVYTKMNKIHYITDIYIHTCLFSSWFFDNSYLFLKSFSQNYPKNLFIWYFNKNLPKDLAIVILFIKLHSKDSIVKFWYLLLQFYFK